MSKKGLTITVRHRDSSETATISAERANMLFTIHHQYCGSDPRVGLFTFVPTLHLCLGILDRHGIWQISNRWEVVSVCVTAGTSWWRVLTRPFKSWSRLHMRPPDANLLRHMPCQLYWYPQTVKTFFMTVYLALARWGMPRAVTDAHVFSCFASYDLLA